MTTPTLDWSYEYLPYTVTDENGIESDLPNFRIFPDDDPELYIAETNEHLPGDVQEKCAQLITAAPQLLEALSFFFNIMQDYRSSARKGYVTIALKQARAAIDKANGKGVI